MQAPQSTLYFDGQLSNKSGDSASPSKSIVQQVVPNAGLESHLHPTPSQRKSLQQTLGRQTTRREKQPQQKRVQALCEKGMSESMEGLRREVLRLFSPVALFSGECYNQLRLLEVESIHLPLPGDPAPPMPCLKPTAIIASAATVCRACLTAAPWLPSRKPPPKVCLLPSTACRDPRQITW